MLELGQADDSSRVMHSTNQWEGGLEEGRLFKSLSSRYSEFDLHQHHEESSQHMGFKEQVAAVCI